MQLKSTRYARGRYERHCRACERWLPMTAEYFYRDRSPGMRGFQYRCIECEKRERIDRINRPLTFGSLSIATSRPSLPPIPTLGMALMSFKRKRVRAW